MAEKIATNSLEKIHNNYLQIKNNYPQYVQRFLICVAACQYLDPDDDLEAILKLRRMAF